MCVCVSKGGCAGRTCMGAQTLTYFDTLQRFDDYVQTNIENNSQRTSEGPRR